MNLYTRTEELKGVGPKTGALLRARGLETAGDLLQYYPARYIHYPAVKCSADTADGEFCALALTVLGGAGMIRAGGKTISNLRAGDAGGEVRLTFFNMPYIVRTYPAGTGRIFCGKMRISERGARRLEQPQAFSREMYAEIGDTLQPVYPVFKGITGRQMSALVRQAVEQVPLQDPLPGDARTRFGLVTLPEAVHDIHFPADEMHLAKARDRLVFEEFFRFILAVRREKERNAAAVQKRPLADHSLPGMLLSALPYELTDAQKRAWEEIRRDLTGPYIMNRLLQGDVGSGKTIVAFLALLLCAGCARQGALMAPTEVLAEQHMANFRSLAEMAGLPVTAVLLTGSVKGAERRETLRKIRSGEAGVIIGTHALIQEKVQYNDLALVITDEQHRFGVRQRETLAGKGEEVPVLVMSATPIPRTLAIILYGDLQVSILDEKPAGRLPVKNTALPSSERNRVLRFLYARIREGRQVYVICPEVEEGMLEDLENVTDYSEKLRKVFPPQVRIASLHGRMKPAEKKAVMDAFAAHETDLLVSTTVIEVGIDVPNATVILIENAERFGMSSLHQLRGRVGRGKEQSYCIFLYSGAAGEKPERLRVLEQTNDGFKVAEEDLRLRGPGDLFGIRQSGDLGFVLGDIYRDAAIMQKAASYADEVLSGETGEGTLPPEEMFGGSKQIDFRSI